MRPVFRVAQVSPKLDARARFASNQFIDGRHYRHHCHGHDVFDNREPRDLHECIDCNASRFHCGATNFVDWGSARSSTKQCRTDWWYCRRSARLSSTGRPDLRCDRVASTSAEPNAAVGAAVAERTGSNINTNIKRCNHTNAWESKSIRSGRQGAQPIRCG